MSVLANVSNLRFSIGSPWDQDFILVYATKEESISNNRASMNIRVMSKLILRAAVSNSIDILISRLKILIDNDSILSVKVNSGIFAAKILNIRNSTNSD